MAGSASLGEGPDTWSCRATHRGVSDADRSLALVASAFGTEIDFLHFRVSSLLSFLVEVKCGTRLVYDTASAMGLSLLLQGIDA